MLDPALRTQILPTPWMRAVVRIAGWWLCATALRYLKPASVPDSAALGVYFLLITPLAIVSLATLFNLLQHRLVPAAGSSEVPPQLLIVLEIMSTVSMVMLLAPW